MSTTERPENAFNIIGFILLSCICMLFFLFIGGPFAYYLYDKYRDYNSIQIALNYALIFILWFALTLFIGGLKNRNEIVKGRLKYMMPFHPSLYK